MDELDVAASVSAMAVDDYMYAEEEMAGRGEPGRQRSSIHRPHHLRRLRRSQ